MSESFSLDLRSAGVLLHPTALPGRYGSGDLGREAFAFVDFLAAAGARWWQMLPIGPIGPGNSPYSSTSAFAGSPLLISLDTLVDDGLLDRDAMKPPVGFDPERVRFPLVQRFRLSRLKLAFHRFSRDADPAARDAFDRFREGAASWLDDYVLFCALRKHFRGKPWNQWPVELRRRHPAAMRRARAEHATAIDYHAFTQFAFERQWAALRDYAHERGVGLMGDVPIFVAGDSADVWGNQELFRLDAAGRAKAVSGCPPDSFSRTGQLWGHPLYHWPAHERSGFQWWIERFRRTLAQFDSARIDHFLGFHRHWAVPGRARTAEHGRYEPSPGRALFKAVHAAIKNPQLIAEDLGNVLPGAVELREACGYPGMRILQNAFWDGARFDQPHNYPARCVAYTGTHDNETATGWFKGLDGRRADDGLTTRARTLRYLNSRGGRIADDMIRALYASPANTVVIPMQDILGLDNRSRMNTPGTARGNWEWRLTPGAARAGHAKRLRGLAETYERGSGSRSAR